jgi:hypothetical protein
VGKWGRKLAGLAGCAVALAALASCGGRHPFERQRAVLEERRPLADGESVLFPLEPGKYRAEVTSAGDGVTVEWRGAPCGLSAETKAYTGTCDFVGEGQLLVRNPRESGQGAPANLFVRVTKLRP